MQWRGCIRRPATPATGTRRSRCGANGTAEPPAHVAEITVLAPINIFADAAGEHHAVDGAEIDNRIGEIEMLDVMGHRTLVSAATSVSAMPSATVCQDRRGRWRRRAPRKIRHGLA